MNRTSLYAEIVTRLCDKLCQWLGTGWSVSSTNKTDWHDITEILLSTINQTNQAYLLFSGLRSYLRKTLKTTTVMSLPVVQMLLLLMEEIRGLMVFNATFNNISVISWLCVNVYQRLAVGRCFLRVSPISSRGCDHMIVGYTNTCSISAHHH
jgi:hypothetical protein